MSLRRPASDLGSQKSLVGGRWVGGWWVGGIEIIESALGPDLENRERE